MTDNIRSFASFEEAQDFLRRANDAADAQLTNEQRRVSYGDTWVRFYDVVNRIVIFGRVETLAEIAEAEARLGAGPAEVANVLRHTEELESHNLLFGYCYSIIERLGELGSTHRANLWPCPPELFEAARLCVWEVDHLAPHHKAQLEALYVEWRANYLKRR